MLKQQKKRMLSAKDVQKLVKHPLKVVRYDELARYDNIHELFKDTDLILLLYTQKKRGNSYVGHWSLLLRPSKKVVEFFDSYAFNVDEAYDRIAETDGNQVLGGYPYLSRLLVDGLDTKLLTKVLYNEVPLQAMKEDVATCGRYAVFRANHYKIPLTKFQRLFKKEIKNGTNIDDLIVKLTEIN